MRFHFSITIFSFFFFFFGDALRIFLENPKLIKNIEYAPIF